VIESFLQFCSCLLQRLESLLCGWDVVWDKVNIDRRRHACDEFVGGLLQRVVLPGVVSIFRNREELRPSSGV
jgi:hypothetical protein